MPTEVLVLMGGPDAEREVSLASGAEVARALRESGRCAVVEAVVDRPGADEIAALHGDVIFPVLHGPWGEGGPLQELLERDGRPYVGSRPKAAALAMDKLASKMLVGVAGVATPPARQLRREDACDLAPPLVIKPVDDGSSVDVVVCRTDVEVDAARARLHALRGRLMAERFVAGREVTVGVLDDGPLPLVEVIPASGLYDYAAKYDRDDTRYVVEPELPQTVVDACRQAAMTAHRTLGCRDVSRVDFILEGATPWFLEINTMPGFTTHSLVPMAAAAAGLPMPALCARLVESARERGSRARRGRSAPAAP